VRSTDHTAPRHVFFSTPLLFIRLEIRNTLRKEYIGYKMIVYSVLHCSFGKCVRSDKCLACYARYCCTGVCRSSYECLLWLIRFQPKLEGALTFHYVTNFLTRHIAVFRAFRLWQTGGLTGMAKITDQFSRRLVPNTPVRSHSVLRSRYFVCCL